MVLLSYLVERFLTKRVTSSELNLLNTQIHTLIMGNSAGDGLSRDKSKHRKWCPLQVVNNSKAFDCVDHNKLWKILKEMGIPDHLTCLLRNLYASQEATVRTGYGTTDWLQIGKGVHQGCILSPCLFNLYAECIMRNAGLEEAQAGIKIAGRNINNLRYAEDTTLMAESEEELKSLLMKVKEESEKAGLKTQHSEN